jgi:hypothetical protein
MLNYHAIPRVFTSEKLSNGATVVTAEGSSVSISVVNGQVMVNDSNVVTPDILAINGVTHGIDTVLTPPSTDAPTSAPTSAATTLFLSLSPNSGLGPSLLGLFVMALTIVW